MIAQRDQDIFQQGHFFEDANILKSARDPGAGDLIRRQVDRCGCPRNSMAPPLGVSRPVIKLKTVVFASAVGPDQTEDSAFGNRQADFLQDLEAAKLLVKPRRAIA